MTKTEYIKKLKRALGRVKKEEREKSLAYFSEVIDDRMEDGVSEQEAIAELESVGDAAERIIAEAEAQGQLRPRRSAWETVLLVLGFPLWCPVLITVLAVIAVTYLLVWVIIVALFTASAALVISGVAGIIGLFVFIGTNALSAFALLGAGFAGAGLGIALFIPVLNLAKAYTKATPVIWNKLTSGKAVF